MFKKKITNFIHLINISTVCFCVLTNVVLSYYRLTMRKLYLTLDMAGTR